MSQDSSDSARTYEERELHWYKNVYKGDNVPQLTVRSVLMGGALGMLMSISNLYTHIKLGWGVGVAITACVLSFVVWRSFMILVPRLTQMSILESNCMQSTASAAGYSTGNTANLTIHRQPIFGNLLHWHYRVALTLCLSQLNTP